MPAILAELDVEDVGTSKVREYRDALTDLVALQQELAAGGGTIGSASSSALSTVVDRVRLVTEAYHDLAEAQAAVVAASAIQSPTGGLQQTIQTANAATEALLDTEQALRTVASTTDAASSGLGAIGASSGDAASALQDVAQATGATNAGLAATGQVTAGVAPALEAVAAGYNDVASAQQAVAAAPPFSPPNLDSFERFAAEVQDGVDAVHASDEAIRTYSGVLAALSTTLTAGEQATLGQAEAMRVLAAAAQENMSFTTQQTEVLEALNAKIAAGIPLTEADVAAMEQLAQSYAATNREALGLATATEQLLAQQRDQAAVIQQTAAAFDVLTSQLTAGATVTRLQKDALAELATAAEGIAALAQEDKDALQALNAAIAEGAVVTPEQAAELERLNAVLESVSGVAEKAASALEELIGTEREAAQAAQQAAEGMQILTAQLQVGSTVTDLQKNALTELNVIVQANAAFSEQTKAATAALSNTIQAGTVITNEQRAAIQGVNTQLQESVKVTEEAASGFDRFKLAAAATAAVLALLVGGLYGLLKESGELAARGEVLSTVLGSVAKNANESHIALETQTQAVKALGIETDEAREAVIKFVQANLQAADASKVARVAQDLAVVAGVNSTQAFETLTQAIQSNQARMLRQFGIVTSSTAIYGEYARSIGKTVKDLTELEQKQAFVNKILSEGEKVAGVYEAAMGNVGKQLTSFKRYVNEAKDALGEALMPVMMLVVSTAADLLKWFTALESGTRVWITAILAGATAMATLSAAIAGAKFLGLVELFKNMAAGVMVLVGAYNAMASAELTAALATKELTVASGGLEAVWAVLSLHPWVLALTALVVVIGLATAAFIKFSNSGREGADALRESYSLLEAKINKVKDSAEALAKLRNASDPTITGIPANAAGPAGAIQAEALEQYNKKNKELQKTLGDTALVLDLVTGRYKVNEEAVAKATAAERKHEEELVGRMKVALADNVAALDANKVALDQMTERQRIATAAHGDSAEAIRLTIEALNDQENALNKNTSGWSDLWTIIKNGTILAGYGVLDFLKKLWTLLVTIADTVRLALIDAFETLNTVLDKVFGAANPLHAFIATVSELLGQLPGVLHKVAAASQGAVDSFNVQGLGAQREEIEKIGKALGIEIAERQKLIAETMKGTDAAKNLSAAQLDANKVLMEGATGAYDQAKQTKLIHEAGADALYKSMQLQTKVIEQRDQVTGRLNRVVVPMTPGDVEAIQSQIEAKVTAHTKKLEAERTAAGKKAESDAKAHKAAVESIWAMGPNELKQAAIFEEVLTKAMEAGGPALQRIITQNASAILKLGSSAELAARGFNNLAAAWETIIAKQETQKSDSEQRREMAGMERALGEMRIEAAQEQQTKFLELERNWANERANVRRDAGRKIEDIDRGIYEREVISRKTAFEQAVYQEKQRIAMVERDMRDEIRQREEALRTEAQAIDERFRLRQQEITNMIRQAAERRAIREIELKEAKETADLMGDPVEMRRAEIRLDVFRKWTSEYNALVKQQADLQTQYAVETRDKERAILNQRVADHQEMTEAQLAALGRLKDESVWNLEQIRIAFDKVRIFGRQVWDVITEGAISGFSKMIQGAMSFKDVLLNIWRGIQSALFGMFENILREWLKKQALMAAASMEGKSGLGGILSGAKALFGMGGGGAASAAGGFGTPISVAGSGGIPGAGGGASAMTSLASGAAAGAAGGFVGFQVGKLFDSRTTGALAGGASGAATGALMGSILPGIGTVVGAVLGGVAGLIGGMLSGGSNARATKQARDAYIEAKGGIEEIKKTAASAGLSVDKLFSTNKPKEFEAELKKIENGAFVNNLLRGFHQVHGGFDQMTADAKAAGISLTGTFARVGLSTEQLVKNVELVNAKFALIDKAGGLMNLRRQAELVGFDIQKAFDSSSIEEFNGHVAELNNLLEAQQKRLQALQTASSGLDQMITGFEEGLRRSFKDLFPSETEFKNFEERLKEARDKGFTGTVRDLDLKDYGFDEKDFEKLGAFLKTAQTEFNALGLIATTTFAGVLRETGDIVQAMQAVSGPLDRIIQLQKDWGFAASETLGPLLAFRQTIKDNEDIANSLSGIVMVVQGLTQANVLNIDTFNALGSVATSNYDKLIARGVAADQAMMLMQPTLQALWEAQQKFHFETDEATQALLNQAVEQGIVGEHQKDINKQILDVLKLIAQALGADLPKAYDTTASAAESAAKRQRDGLGGVIDRAREAADGYRKMRDAAVEAGDAAEDAATGAAEGHSPTGLKQVVVRLTEAIGLYQTWGGTAVGAGQTAEGAAAAAALAVGKIGDAQSKVTFGSKEAADGVAAYMASLTEEQRRQTEEAMRDFNAMLAAMFADGAHVMSAATAETMRVAAEAAAGQEEGLSKVISRAAEAADAYRKMGEAAGAAGRMAEDAATGAAEGHSPTGLKQVVLRLNESIGLYREWGDIARQAGRNAEASATDAAGTVPNYEGVRKNGTTGGDTYVTHHTTEITVAPHITSMDGQDAKRVWDEKIKPEVISQFENNTGQIAARVGNATSKYRSQNQKP